MRVIRHEPCPKVNHIFLVTPNCYPAKYFIEIRHQMFELTVYGQKTAQSHHPVKSNKVSYRKQIAPQHSSVSQKRLPRPVPPQGWGKVDPVKKFYFQLAKFGCSVIPGTRICWGPKIGGGAPVPTL